MRIANSPVGGLHGQTLTRGLLAGLKLRALRRRVWFQTLDRLERGLVDLTIRYVDQVKSSRLRQVLMEILEKLAQTMQSSMVRVLECGRRLALGASLLAVRWGNDSALGWRWDKEFWRALGFRVSFGGLDKNG